MSGLKSIVSLVILAIAILVVVQNQTPTIVVFFGTASPSLPLGLWAVIAAAIGALVMWLLSLVLAIGGSGRRPLPRSRRPGSPDSPNAPDAPRPPRRSRDREIDREMGNETDGEIWDEDGEWDDRARRESHYAPHLNEPREPWEGMDDETESEPDAPNEPRDRNAPDGNFSDSDFPSGDPPDEFPDDAPPGEVPLDLPPPSRYEQPQQPIETVRQGSVYSFSYAKGERPTDEPGSPIDFGRSDDRVPLDLPQRDASRREASKPVATELDNLEEITPIVEPPDDVPPPVDRPRRREMRRPNRDESRRERTHETRDRSDWEDWNRGQRNDSDWI